MSMIKAMASDGTSGQFEVEIDQYPNHCPYCHHTINPLRMGLFIIDGESLTGVYRCSYLKCNQVFLSFYSIQNYETEFYFYGSSLGNLVSKDFAEDINEISPSFIEIYNQAYSAEQYDLLQICGIGYRKALEFLIKDYLININPEKAESIKKRPLGNCIKQDLEAPKVKLIAERAVWLGNDETHYTRVWEDKELRDLKMLIDLVIHHIESDLLTKKILEDMPDGKNKL